MVSWTHFATYDIPRKAPYCETKDRSVTRGTGIDENPRDNNLKGKPAPKPCAPEVI